MCETRGRNTSRTKENKKKAFAGAQKERGCELANVGPCRALGRPESRLQPLPWASPWLRRHQGDEETSEGGSSSAGQQLVQRSHQQVSALPKLQDVVRAGIWKPPGGGREHPREPASPRSHWPLHLRSLSKRLSGTSYVPGRSRCRKYRRKRPCSPPPMELAF